MSYIPGPIFGAKVLEMRSATPDVSSILAILVWALATKEWIHERMGKNLMIVQGRRGVMPVVMASEVLDANSTYYGREIRPLLLARCVRCHGSRHQHGGLRLDSVAAILRGNGGPAVVPGKSAQSVLLARIHSQEMPEEGPPLTAAEAEHFRRWIDEGAVAPRDDRPVNIAARTGRSSRSRRFRCQR